MEKPISLDEYALRRQRIMEYMEPDSVAIVVAAPETLRNGDSHYPYRQNSDFYYLTGFSEPEAVALLIPGREKGEFILFNRPRDPDKEVWNGIRAGQEGAVNQYAADEAYAFHDLNRYIIELLEGKRRIYYSMGKSAKFDKRLLSWVNQLRGKVRMGINAPDIIDNLDMLLRELRLYKSAAELSLLRYSAEVSAKAHRRAMQVCEPGMYEHQLEAELHYVFGKSGCRFPAYTSIVGGGANACILHYIENNALLKDGDLLLIDAGAEYENYAADITRTFPVNGRFTSQQRDLYEIVLASQMAAIETAKPGEPWHAMQDAIVPILTQGMVDLGILKGNVDNLIESGAYQRFYLHLSGHWLGLDVHDVGTYKTNGDWRDLEPGMVLTIEPGLYIQAGSEGVDEKWWNMGIRIEDDVLVTQKGCDVLSKDVPKTITDIEALMAEKL